MHSFWASREKLPLTTWNGQSLNRIYLESSSICQHISINSLFLFIPFQWYQLYGFPIRSCLALHVFSYAICDHQNWSCNCLFSNYLNSTFIIFTFGWSRKVLKVSKFVVSTQFSQFVNKDIWMRNTF